MSIRTAVAQNDETPVEPLATGPTPGDHQPAPPNVCPLGADHVIAYRISIPFLGGRYYTAFFVGREQRSLERLAAENQRKSWLHTTVSFSAVSRICEILPADDSMISVCSV